MKIYLNKEAYDLISIEVKKSHGLETGGILLGVYLKSGDVLITHAIGPGPKAMMERSVFKKDYEYSIKMLNKYYKNYSVDFMGDWHLHPNNCTKYSLKDNKSMRNIATINERKCIFIIVGNDMNMSVYSSNYRDWKIYKHKIKITDSVEEIANKKGIII